MIVVDASVIFHILISPADDPHVIGETESAGQLLAPHILDLEVMQALRRSLAAGTVSPVRARQAITDLQAFTIERHSTNPLTERIWELRHNMTPYDAAYVALAELLAIPFYTRDKRLAGAAGAKTVVKLL